MGWENRKNGRYYYTARKVNGKTVKQYAGAGWFGQYCAAEAEVARSNAEIARIEKQLQRLELDGLRELESLLKADGKALMPIVSAALEAAGYHQHKRGEWRKKRVGRKALVRIPKPGNAEYIPSDKEARRTLVLGSLENGLSEARALAILEAHPHEVGAYAGNSVHAVLPLVTSGPVHKKVVEQEAEAKRAALAGPNPTPLELLLVDRVVSCWLSVAFYERQNALFLTKPGGTSNANQEFLQKRIDIAQKRYIAAIKALAQIRRLQIPINVQVNVAAAGGQQVNVAGDVAANKPNT